jgi:hypothetical protein
MRYLFLFLICFSSLAAEKFYYIKNGWLGTSEQVEVNGVFIQTPNGFPLCEATIIDHNTNFPIPYSYLERDSNDVILCPVQISESRKNQELAKDLIEKAIIKKSIDRECGEKIVDFVAYKNDLKSLTDQQRIDMSALYSLPKMLLKDGSLLIAKSKISEIIPDGILITASDQSEIISRINSCLGE